MPSVLAFSGSSREASVNKKLVRAAAQAVRGAGAEVDVIDLRDYPMPLYNGDEEQSEGPPANAARVGRQVRPGSRRSQSMKRLPRASEMPPNKFERLALGVLIEIEPLQLDATIPGAADFRVVARDRLAFAVALGLQARGLHSGVDQLLDDRLGPALRELEVVGV